MYMDIYGIWEGLGYMEGNGYCVLICLLCVYCVFMYLYIIYGMSMIICIVYGIYGNI